MMETTGYLIGEWKRKKREDLLADPDELDKIE